MIQTVHTWANIALTFLILLSLLVWAIPLALLIFSVRGMRGAQQRLEELLPRAQQRAHQAADMVDRGGRRVVRPLIRAHAWWAGVQATVHALYDRSRPSATPPTNRNDEVTE